MSEEILANPDYQLVIAFLQNITPGDMSPEAANQLIAIGQRIQGGGVLTDKEREMFIEVVGNISSYAPANNFGSMSEDEARLARGQVSMGSISQGEGRIKPEGEDPRSRLMNMIRSGQITMDEARLAMDAAMPSDINSEDMRRFMDMKSAAQTKMGMPGPGMMPSADGMTYGPSSGVSMDPNVMDMQQMIDTGIINPQRPQMRPSAAPMTSPPPQMRPQNLGGR